MSQRSNSRKAEIMSKARKSKELVSIVIPLYNEEENLPKLHQELTAVLDGLPYEFEIVVVDDGSADGTLAAVEQIAKTDRRFKAVSLSRNFGHQAALVAGLDAAEGEAVITMDGDLQHPPRLIPEMLKRWKDGFDVVYSVRKNTAGVSRRKLLTARLFYAFLNRVGNIGLPANTADFRLLARPVVEELKTMQERSVFLRGLVKWVGFRQSQIDYEADKRFAGRTKYSFRSMLKFAVTGITSFSTSPLYLALIFGFLVSLVCFFYAVYIIYLKLYTTELISGFATIVVAILFLGGIQLITIGIIGLYMGRLYDEVKKRPRYIVQRRIGSFHA